MGENTKTHHQIIGIFLVISLLIVLIEPPLAFGEGRLTLKTSHKSVYLGEQITFSGKLTDRNNYAISGATIIIWETDDGRVQQIAETTTNARGEYRATTTAKYWDGVGNQVEVYAFSTIGSVKSQTISINIDKPYAGQNFGNTGSTGTSASNSGFETTVSTNLLLYREVNEALGTIKLYPELTTNFGDLIHSNLIKIYVNGEFYQTVSSNEWSNGMPMTLDSCLAFEGVYSSIKVGSTTYKGSSETQFYNCTEKEFKTNITQKTTTTTTQTSNDDLSKNTVDKAKSSYWDTIQMLYDGIKQSEDSLSGLVFENSDAQKKIDTAWSIRSMSHDSLEKARDIMYTGDSYLKNRNYDQAYSKMREVDAYIDSINSDLSVIAKEINNAKKLEHDYLERNKFCFLFWCTEVKKLDYVDLRVRDIELEIQKITNKKDALRSNFETFEIKKTANLQLSQKQLELESEQFAKQKKEQELAQKQIELKAEQLAKEQKQRELDYKQEQLELEQIENDKKSILADYSWSPFIMGLTDGELTYYVQPLPSYASQDVRNKVDAIADWMDGKTMYGGIKLKRVYEYSYSDFSVNWVKDYQEEALGRQVGDYLIVGLGKGNCFGDWMPFDGYTVSTIMWHEIGHALGYEHVSDSNNIMYKHGAGNNFELEYKDRIDLADGYSQRINLCHGGSFYYKTESTSQNVGYKVYVVPPNTDSRDVINGDASFYLDCSAYESSMISFSRECTVDSGSYILIQNPSSLGLGNAVSVDLEIYDRTPDKKVDLDFDESHMYFSEYYIDYVKTLFRN